MSKGSKLYLRQSVLEAAEERMRLIFDRFGEVVVSVSGGKDSTVALELARREGVRRGRTVHAFFLDQEAEYRATVEQVRHMLHQPGVQGHWYQVPLRMTNATSYEQEFLHAWAPGEPWMREQEPDAITGVAAPDRFYGFFPWLEKHWGRDTCFIIGLRAEESLNRFRAVTRHPAVDGLMWSSPGDCGAIRMFPLYDWTFEDVWTYIGNEGLIYNHIYDLMWAKGRKIPELRVSNLIHEMAFRSLEDLQEFEPDTYEALLRRLKGVTTAARYAGERTVFRASKLPDGFASWRAYRDFLLETYPGSPERRQAFIDRFARQKQTESVFRQQAGQLMINDWENNVPVQQSAVDKKAATLAKWKEIL